MTTRRGFLQLAASAVGAYAVGTATSSAAGAPPLIDAVAETCRRLAPLGWRELLLDVTGGALDITAAQFHHMRKGDNGALQEKHADAIRRMYEAAGMNLKTASEGAKASLWMRLIDEARKGGMRFPA